MTPQQQEMMQMLSMIMEQQQMQGMGYFQSPASSMGRASIRHQGGSWGPPPSGLASMGGQFGMLGSLAGQLLQGPLDSWLGGHGFQSGGFGTGFSNMDRRLNAQYSQDLNIATSTARESDLRQVQQYADRIAAMRYHDDPDSAANASGRFMEGYRNLAESSAGGMILDQLHQQFLPGGSTTDFATRLFDASRTNQLGRGTSVDPGTVAQFSEFARDRWITDGQINHGAMRGFDMGEFGKMAQALAESGSLDLVSTLNLDEAGATRKFEAAGEQLEKLAGVLDAVRELTGSHGAPVEALMEQLDVLTAGGLSTGMSLDKMERTIHRARSLGRQSQITDEAMFDMISRQSERAVGLGYRREAGIGIAERTAAMAGTGWALGTDTYTGNTFEDVVSHISAEQEDMLMSQGVRDISALAGMRSEHGVEFGGELDTLLDKVNSGTISSDEMSRLLELTHPSQIDTTIRQAARDTNNAALGNWFGAARNNDRFVADHQRILESGGVMTGLMQNRRDELIEDIANASMDVVTSDSGITRQNLEEALQASLDLSAADMDGLSPQEREQARRQAMVDSLRASGASETQAQTMATRLISQVDRDAGNMGAWAATYSTETLQARDRNLRTAEIAAGVETDLRAAGVGVGRGVLSSLMTGFLNPENLNEDGSINYAALISQASGGFRTEDVQSLMEGNAEFRALATDVANRRAAVEDVHEQLVDARKEGDTERIAQLEEESNKKRTELKEGMAQLADAMSELGISIKRSDAGRIDRASVTAMARLRGARTEAEILDEMTAAADSMSMSDEQRQALRDEFGEDAIEILAEHDERMKRAEDIQERARGIVVDEDLTDEERTEALEAIKTEFLDLLRDVRAASQEEFVINKSAPYADTELDSSTEDKAPTANKDSEALGSADGAGSAEADARSDPALKPIDAEDTGSGAFRMLHPQTAVKFIFEGITGQQLELMGRTADGG